MQHHDDALCIYEVVQYKMDFQYAFNMQPSVVLQKAVYSLMRDEDLLIVLRCFQNSVIPCLV